MGIHGNVGVGMSGMCEGHSVGIMVWGIWPILNSVSVLLPPCTDPEPVRREAQAYPASPVRGAAGEQRGGGGSSALGSMMRGMFSWGGAPSSPRGVIRALETELSTLDGLHK